MPSRPPSPWAQWGWYWLRWWPASWGSLGAGSAERAATCRWRRKPSRASGWYCCAHQEGNRLAFIEAGQGAEVLKKRAIPLFVGLDVRYGRRCANRGKRLGPHLLEGVGEVDDMKRRQVGQESNLQPAVLESASFCSSLSANGRDRRKCRRLWIVFFVAVRPWSPALSSASSSTSTGLEARLVPSGHSRLHTSAEAKAQVTSCCVRHCAHVVVAVGVRTGVKR